MDRLEDSSLMASERWKMRAIDSLRRTGRTTRMLLRATELHMQGRAVYIVAGSEMERQRLCEALRSFAHNNSIKVELLSDLPNFDLTTMCLRGAHPNCVVLVDHHVIERRFEAMLRELHAYDQREESTLPAQVKPQSPGAHK